MRPNLASLLLCTAFLSSAPAWSAARKPADKAVASRKPAEKTVTGTLVSVEDNGTGDTYTVETPDGKKLQVMSTDPEMTRPEDVKDGAQVVLTYADVSALRVTEVHPLEGSAPRKKGAATVQGTLVGYQGGDLGGFIVLEEDGKQENYPTTPNVLGPDKVAALTGKQVELVLTRTTTRELREIKPKP